MRFGRQHYGVSGVGTVLIFAVVLVFATSCSSEIESNLAIETVASDLAFERDDLVGFWMGEDFIISRNIHRTFIIQMRGDNTYDIVFREIYRSRYDFTTFEHEFGTWRFASGVMYTATEGREEYGYRVASFEDDLLTYQAVDSFGNRIYEKRKLAGDEGAAILQEFLAFSGADPSVTSNAVNPQSP